MKPLFICLLLLAAAYASITMTNPFSASSGGTVVETDPQSGINNYSVVYSDVPTLDVYIHQGTVSGQSINRGTIAPIIQFNVNLQSGVWRASNGTSGTLTPSNLTNLNTAMRNNRNAMETMLVQNGVILGTQVPW